MLILRVTRCIVLNFSIFQPNSSDSIRFGSGRGTLDAASPRALDLAHVQLPCWSYKTSDASHPGESIQYPASPGYLLLDYMYRIRTHEFRLVVFWIQMVRSLQDSLVREGK
jgi:hypothetical protein